jgi:hypothetical protein
MRSGSLSSVLYRLACERGGDRLNWVGSPLVESDIGGIYGCREQTRQEQGCGYHGVM